MMSKYNAVWIWVIIMIWNPPIALLLLGLYWLDIIKLED